VQLAAPHIDPHDLGGSPLQQAVGKPTGRLAQIQTVKTVHTQAAGAQSPLELESTSRQKTHFGRIDELKLSLGGKLISIFGDSPPGPVRLSPTHTRGDQALSLSARGGMTAFDKK
jgi:hypothetical protein